MYVYMCSSFTLLFMVSKLIGNTCVDGTTWDCIPILVNHGTKPPSINTIPSHGSPVDRHSRRGNRPGRSQLLKLFL